MTTIKLVPIKLVFYLPAFLAITINLIACDILSSDEGISSSVKPTQEVVFNNNSIGKISSIMEIKIGFSTEHRDIYAYRFGSGRNKLLVVGGIHGGYEGNTIALSNRLVSYFEDNPGSIPDDVSLYIIPNLNPDGYEYDTRTNANGVDLNRNWDCKWKPTAYHKSNSISPGAFAFSELETQQLRDFVLDQNINAIIFYHSQAGTVGPGVCGTNVDNARKLGSRIARATGYSYDENSQYPVSGDASGYFNNLGITAVDIELTNHSDIEFETNVAAVLESMRWLLQSQ